MLVFNIVILFILLTYPHKLTTFKRIRMKCCKHFKKIAKCKLQLEFWSFRLPKLPALQPISQEMDNMIGSDLIIHIN